MPRNDFIQVRRGSTPGWEGADPVLGAGEPGLDLTTGVFKVGNGVDVWVDLPAVNQAPAPISDGPSGGGGAIGTGDSGGVIGVDDPDDTEVTIPPTTDEPFTPGNSVTIVQRGAGRVTLEEGDGVTIVAPKGKQPATRTEGSTIEALMVEDDVWVVSGDLAGSELSVPVDKTDDFDLRAVDAGSTFVCDKATPLVVTVLDAADEPYVPGQFFYFLQIDAPVQFAAADAAVFVSRDDSTETSAPGVMASLSYLGGDRWALVGVLA